MIPLVVSDMEAAMSKNVFGLEVQLGAGRCALTRIVGFLNRPGAKSSPLKKRLEGSIQWLTDGRSDIVSVPLDLGDLLVETVSEAASSGKVYTRLADFLQDLPGFLSDNEEILKGVPMGHLYKKGRDNPWTEGGCYLLAEALAKFLGPKAEVIGVWGKPVADRDDGPDIVEKHAVVSFGASRNPNNRHFDGVLIDARGQVSKEVACNRPEYRWFGEHKASKDQAPAGKVKALAKMLEARFGTVV